MAVVIDATMGGAEANSYATVEEANNYLEAEFGAEEWADLDEEIKAKLLITATRMIDELAVKYSSIATTQALNFPLNNTSEDNRGNGFREAKTASIIQAFYLHINADTIRESQQQAIQGVKWEQIGPIQKQVTGTNPFRRFDSRVYKLLAYHVDFTYKLNRA